MKITRKCAQVHGCVCSTVLLGNYWPHSVPPAASLQSQMKTRARGEPKSHQWGSNMARCSFDTNEGESVKWKQALKPIP